MSLIPFSSSEEWVVKKTLEERYGRAWLVEEAEVEMRLDADSFTLTSCAALYWEADHCHFVVVKTRLGEFRCQFFYRGHQQFGTGKEIYDNVGDCVITLLQTHTEYEKSHSDSQK